MRKTLVILVLCLAAFVPYIVANIYFDVTPDWEIAIKAWGWASILGLLIFNTTQGTDPAAAWGESALKLLGMMLFGYFLLIIALLFFFSTVKPLLWRTSNKAYTVVFLGASVIPMCAIIGGQHLLQSSWEFMWYITTMQTIAIILWWGGYLATLKMDLDDAVAGDSVVLTLEGILDYIAAVGGGICMPVFMAYLNLKQRKPQEGY